MGVQYRRSPDALSADVGEDVVALQAVHGFAYGMEGVTASVWQLLAEPKALDDILDRLLADYEVDPEQCRSEVTELLQQLVAEGLVEEVDA